MHSQSTPPCGLCGVVDCGHRRANRARAIDPAIGSTLIRPCDRCGQDYPARVRSLRKGVGQFCPGECARLGRRHRAKTAPADRFWPYVDVRGPAECWPWLKALSRYGYGLFMLEVGTQITASRFAYILTYGPIPDDQVVCHSCDNPPCCNPAHLFLGTKTDNNLDRDSKGRQAKGERSRSATQTPASVRAIRDRHAAGESQTDLAYEYGISQPSISAIVLRKTWKHVE